MSDKKNKINDKKEAVALRYTPGKDQAPKIIASGKGDFADRIIDKAKENEIPVVEDGNLANTLVSFKVGAEIPPELYEVVAEILIFISKLDSGYGEKYGQR